MADSNERCEPDFAAFIGIDWADQSHAWALQTTIKGAIEHGDLDHTPEAVDAWATELGCRFGGRPVAIALEQSRGALLFMLTKYAHFVLYPIHPTTLANYRLGFRPSGAKSVALYMMHYNFGRKHTTLGTTPAVKAGITDHIWSVEEIVGMLEANEPKATRPARAASSN